MIVHGEKFADLPRLSDHLRMEQQVALLAGGSAGLDVEAETFAPSRDEWTNDRRAIRRQRAVVLEGHRGQPAEPAITDG